jgi:hypothetical protein
MWFSVLLIANIPLANQDNPLKIFTNVKVLFDSTFFKKNKIKNLTNNSKYKIFKIIFIFISHQNTLKK